MRIRVIYLTYPRLIYLVNVIREIENNNLEIPELSKNQIEKLVAPNPGSRVFLYRVVGILTYLNSSQHEFKFSRKLSPGDIGIISFRYVTMADHDGLQNIINFITSMEKKGVTMIVTGVRKKMKQKIDSVEGLADTVTTDVAGYGD